MDGSQVIGRARVSQLLSFAQGKHFRRSLESAWYGLIIGCLSPGFPDMLRQSEVPQGDLVDMAELAILRGVVQ